MFDVLLPTKGDVLGIYLLTINLDRDKGVCIFLKPVVSRHCVPVT